MEGKWLLTVPVDTGASEFDSGIMSETLEIAVELERADSGELVGRGTSEYGEETYSNLEVLDAVEVDGKTSFMLKGFTDDHGDRMEIEFFDEDESAGTMEGMTEGEVGIYDPDVAGTFVGERQ